MRNSSLFVLTLVFLSFVGQRLSAQIEAKYMDPEQFYTLDADRRSEDGRARAITVYLNNGMTEVPLVQVLTPDGKMFSSSLSDFNNGHSTRELHSIKTADGKTLYLYLYTQWSTSHDCSHATTDGVVVYCPGKDGKLQRVPVFRTSRKDLDKIVCEWENDLHIRNVDYEYYYHYDLDETETYPGIHYDSKTSTLYVPLIENNDKGSFSHKYTNRFLVYRFDGNVFRYRGNEAPVWLHSSLKDYVSTEMFLQTTDYMIQIDVLKDGSYRYASWKGAETRSDRMRKPDLVIGNGTCSKKGVYTFKNKTYTYIVDSEDARLVVKNNGIKILDQAFE